MAFKISISHQLVTIIDNNIANNDDYVFSNFHESVNLMHIFLLKQIY